ncbi:MAG: UDP-N-acetylmuramoyl-L-alanyl-D-glutamate--2,6-diaminopimelate ligase [Brooklawnia sp.]|jgi:UDP-N-acetylmuramoyl-L-alanyl-D-glutamate--2,6-diaminopimelate ligase
MTLSALLAGLPVQLPAADPVVTGVVLDSRRVGPGDLYIGLQGATRHGAEFAAQAARAGAVAVLTDPQGAPLAAASGLPVATTVQVREAMAVAAARCHGHPARSMTCFAVTGTNGKSTTVLMLSAALNGAGRRCGSIGTLGILLGDEQLPMHTSTVTTPEAPDLQAILAQFSQAGAEAMAMEVSSHALALQRAAGITFDVVGFTNLGRDHLDFHDTIEDYFAAKARLFTPGYACRAVINADDPAGLQLLDQAAALGLPAVSVGSAVDCDYRISGWRTDGAGTRFTLEHPHGTLEARLGLPGDYNVRNGALALAMIDQAGLDMHAALPGLARAIIPGRMQPVELPGAQAPRCYVDFAHTPQAITSALAALNHPGDQGRVIAVLGAGGDRDPDKREPMGRAAARGADVVVVTDDNPRSEDPAPIRARVLAGARASGTTEAVDGGDRRSAIRLALSLAGPADSVAILGKGHERTQQLADQTVEFDDVAVARQEWAALRGPLGDQQ